LEVWRLGGWGGLGHFLFFFLVFGDLGEAGGCTRGIWEVREVGLMGGF